MELVHYPAEILNKQLKLVDIENIDFDPNELLKEMSDIMLGSDGVGLAACQVGIDRSLFIMGDKVAGVKMFINPQVLQHTSDTSLDYEGCLSFPGMFVKVKRPKETLCNKQLKLTIILPGCFCTNGIICKVLHLKTE
jgi:peptide deformylase